jgi:hypothetical protein
MQNCVIGSNVTKTTGNPQLHDRKANTALRIVPIKMHDGDINKERRLNKGA